MISSNQIATTSGSELKLMPYCSRKRKHELEPTSPNSKSERQQELLRNYNALQTLDLSSLFNELDLSDCRIERINDKDMICDEFIDRIGKLYKPKLSIEQDKNSNAKANQVSLNDKRSSNKNPSIEYDVISHFQDRMLKHCSEELLLPFTNFEDVVMGLAVIYFGEAFTHNESLNRTLCEYISTMSNENDGTDGEYDSDICLGNFNTQKRKRRKIMSSCPLFK